MPSSAPQPDPFQAPASGRDGAEAWLLSNYDQLRAQAAAFLRDERRGHTLNATALVHEAYLKLSCQQRAAWPDRAYFMAIAAQQMRRVLQDHAKGRDRDKRGGGRQRVTLSEGSLESSAVDVDPLELEDALRRLAELDERQARIAEMRLLCGMKVSDVAAVLSISDRLVEGEWAFAKAWLRRELSSGADDSEREPGVT